MSRRVVAPFVVATLSGILFVSPLFYPPDATSVGSMQAGGQVSSSLSLASGGIAGGAGSNSGRVTIQSTPGAVDSTDTIDFGDLTTGTGEPIVVGVNFQLRGNSPYRLNISESSFSATGLQHLGRNISGDTNRGTFIKIRVGNIAGSGPRANVAGSSASSAMSGGLTLDRISQGPVGQNSTSICTGEPPSTAGTSTSPDNAVTIPIYFTIPSGLDLSPAPGTATGRFQVTLQLGAFAQ